jgi:hypothetical protein
VAGKQCVPGVKWPGSDVNDSTPPSAEVKNGRNYKSSPPIRLYGVDRGSFVFSVYGLKRCGISHRHRIRSGRCRKVQLDLGRLDQYDPIGPRANGGFAHY